MKITSTLQVAIICLCFFLSLSFAIYIEEDQTSWSLLGDASPSDKVNLIIAIKQQNVDQLSNIFWQVSDPKSPNYGKYLTADEVSKLVMPSAETLKAVTEWVYSQGIQAHEVTFTRSMDMMMLTTTVARAGSMLNTKYVNYKHTSSGKVIIKSTESYTVPEGVRKHVDCVVGHTSFPLAKPMTVSSGVGADAPVTPSVLRQRYNVSSTLVGTAKNNSYAVAEFQAQYFSPSDLQTFFKSEVPFAPDAYTVDHIVGGNEGSNPGVEANLDIQFIMGVAPKVTSWFWSNPQMDFFTDIVNWLGQIDNTVDAPLVHSVSYGSQTQWPTSDVHDRVDIEFQKSGARGISIIFASGDSGTGCLVCFSFRPSWPASSDYVTSVGATRFVDGVSGDEMAVSEFGSGGGFSSADNQPSYQTAAVAQYFKVQTDLPAAHFYNKTGRGTPDVAALGIGFQVVVSGRVQSVGGTSASAPTFSAIISLLNDIRLNNNKAPLGFLNPWLYQTQAANPTAFFDVTEGNNQHGCCGLTGFKAAPGWDPVTGLGTPNFDVLSKLV